MKIERGTKFYSMVVDVKQILICGNENQYWLLLREKKRQKLQMSTEHLNSLELLIKQFRPLIMVLRINLIGMIFMNRGGKQILMEIDSEKRCGNEHFKAL